MIDFSVYCEQDSTHKELSGKFDAQQASALDLLHKASAGSDKALVEQAVSANDQLTDTSKLLQIRREQLKASYENAQAEEEAAQRGMTAVNTDLTGGNGGVSRKSLLQAIEESKEIASLPRATYGDVRMIDWTHPDARKTIQLKLGAKDVNMRGILAPNSMRAANEITTSAAASPYQIINETVPYGLFDTTILDVVPTFQMTNKTVTYRKQTALTRNEAATAEATQVASKSTFTITTPTDTAHMIKGYFVVTEEELMSRADALQFIVNEAHRDIRRTAANEILQGNNTGEHLYGIYNQAGQTFTKGTSLPLNDNNGNAITNIDALGYAYQDCRVTGVCRPNLVFMHPNQFMPIRLLKNAIGDYIYGPPNQPMSDFYILGTRFMEEIEAIDGQAILGDFATYYSLGIFQGITVEIGVDGNDFTKWQRTVRFSFYGVNQVRRTTAFEIVAGL